MPTSVKGARSKNMSSIRSSNTRPELFVRSYLHRIGLRFRLHDKSLPGSPDIVVPRLKTVIFVHGCFWHRHVGCAFTTTPATNVEFWARKFAENTSRDRRVVTSLHALGWRVRVLWACQLGKFGALDALAVDLLSASDR